MEIEIILYICLRSYQESAFIQQNLFQTSRNTQIPQVRLSMSRIWPQLQFATSIRVKENPDVEEIDSDDEELSNEENQIVPGGFKKKLGKAKLAEYECSGRFRA